MKKLLLILIFYFCNKMENEHTLTFLFNNDFFIYTFKNKCSNCVHNNVKLKITMKNQR